MPAEGIHLTSLREGLALARLSRDGSQAVARAEHATRLGAIFVDLPYFAAFTEELFRYVVGMAPRPNAWGDRTHEHAVSFLHALIRRVAAAERDLDGDEARAFTIGLASHLAIDQTVHPLVNWLADAEVARRGVSHASAHREVEKFQSICFHEAYFGADMMGTAEARKHIHIAGIERLERSRVVPLALLAMTDAIGCAPALDDVASWGRNFVRHGKLLGGPIGRRVAPPAAKEAARPRFLHGSWGTFEARLTEAIKASGRVLEAVDALLDGPPHELSAAEVHAGLDGLLDLGTIDPPGSTFVV